MSPLSRRELVQSIGFCALARAVPRAARRLGLPDLQEIARKIVRTPRSEIFDLAEKLLGEGLDWRDLEAAIFLAGILEIRPRPTGQLLHAVLVAESVYQLAEASPEEERLLPVLFNLDDVKRSQDGDAAGPNWALHRRPEARTSDREAARAELTRALEAWDAERGDQAIVDLLALGDREGAFEIVWRQAIRDLGSLGHKVIFAAQAERTLRRVPAEFAVPTLRSVVFGITAESRGGDLVDHDASREAAREIPQAWREGDASPGESLALARAFLEGGPANARAKLVEALRAGATAKTAWDAVRLSACELFARGPGLVPVHPTTISNALFHIHRSTSDEATRRISVLQAASWIPRLREVLADRGQISRTEGVTKDLLASPDRDGDSLEEIFQAPAIPRVLSHLSKRDRIAPFTASMRSHLFRGIDDNHQAKYAVALLEDVAECHPRWGPVLLAPSLGYLPSGGNPATPVYERSRELLVRMKKG